MKSLFKLTLAAAALALASHASAQTIINMTGSTAFRSAVHASIIAAMGGSGACTYAYEQSTLNASNFSIFHGNVSGSPYIVRCGWSGSAQGVGSVANATPVSVYKTTIIGTSGAGSASTATSGNVENTICRFAFSDVFQSSTIYTSPSLVNNNVGVVPFLMIASQDAPASLTNVTDQQFEALFVQGFQPLSLFTGDAADAGVTVWATGRDPGSGTRITTLAETRYGIFSSVVQWKATTTGAEPNKKVTAIQLWPTTGSGSDPTAGNGGYTSGSGVRDALGTDNDDTVGTDVLDDTGALLFNIPATDPVVLLSYPGINDGNTAIANGAKLLKYNGYDYSPDKVYNGQYTLWGYQHLYHVSGLTTGTGSETAFKTALIAQIPANIGSAGLNTSAMNVVRSSDGGLVTP